MVRKSKNQYKVIAAKEATKKSNKANNAKQGKLLLFWIELYNIIFD